MSAPDPARRRESSRQAIFQATRALLLESGFRGVTIEAIAARAGVGKQTIYRWWPSKGAVVFDAILAGNATPAGTHALPDTGDLEHDLRSVVRAIVAELADPAVDRFQRTVAAEIQHDEPLARELVDRLLAPQLEAIAERLRAAQRTGDLGDDLDLGVAVEQLVGPPFHRWLLRTAPLDAAYADAVVRQALAGLSPRSSTRP